MRISKKWMRKHPKLGNRIVAYTSWFAQADFEVFVKARWEETNSTPTWVAPAGINRGTITAPNVEHTDMP